MKLTLIIDFHQTDIIQGSYVHSWKVCFLPDLWFEKKDIISHNYMKVLFFSSPPLLWTTTWPRLTHKMMIFVGEHSFGLGVTRHLVYPGQFQFMSAVPVACLVGTPFYPQKGTCIDAKLYRHCVCGQLPLVLRG